MQTAIRAVWPVHVNSRQNYSEGGSPSRPWRAAGVIRYQTNLGARRGEFKAVTALRTSGRSKPATIHTDEAVCVAPRLRRVTNLCFAIGHLPKHLACSGGEKEGGLEADRRDHQEEEARNAEGMF